MNYLRDKHPFLQLKLKLPSLGWTPLECIIDTGFSGGLALPKQFRTEFPEDEFIESRYTLADGSEVVVDTTYSTVLYETHKKDIALVFMDGDDNLVGIEFLDQMRFYLDLIDYKVSLEERNSRKG